MSSAPHSCSLFLPSEEETARLGRWLARRVRPGDTILLDGPIGSGKTHLARALIRERLRRSEDVPSPTFTLVQTYAADGTEIWHADLYRLSHPDEVAELGLEDAFETAVCLVEWPDRLGQSAPDSALRLRFSAEGDGRRLDVSGGERWAGRIADLAAEDRAAQSVAFLVREGWGEAARRFLAGDASARSYDRLTLGAKTAVLMDAPPGKGEDTGAFVRIARHLSSLGLSAPRVLAEDGAAGFLLLEDLGDTLFARLVPQSPDLESTLYAAAVDVLIHLQAHPAPPGLADASAADWASAAAFVLDWYRLAITGERIDTAEFRTRIETAQHALADGPRVMILRDYHAENLIWLPERSGLARVGLLDFQLAQMGQPGYDLVSLCQDARRDVPLAVERAMVLHFVEAIGVAEADFAPAYAMLGAQRALRILGIFARLSLVVGKPGYVALIPRVWAQLQRNLAHPALAPLAAICGRLLPEPTPDRLERIRAQCGSHAP